MSKPRGLNLIELMVVVAILAIIAAIAVPLLQRAQQPPFKQLSTNVFGQQVWHVEYGKLDEFLVQKAGMKIISLACEAQRDGYIIVFEAPKTEQEAPDGKASNVRP